MNDQALAPAPQANVPARRVSLVEKMAARFHVEPSKLLDTLKATAFRQRDGIVVSNEQMMALLVIADQYGLNPFTKEIYAFEDKGGIVPVVSVDGWLRIINQHPQYDGVEFNYAPEMATPAGGKPCPEWCEAVIGRKDRSKPAVVREYLDEVYVPPRKGRSKYKEGDTYEIAGPWQTHTKRMLRHKALIQGARVAFGFAGIYDEDEAGRILEASRAADGSFEVQPPAGPAPKDATEKVEAMKARLRPSPPPEDEPLDVDPETGEVLSGAPAGGGSPDEPPKGKGKGKGSADFADIDPEVGF